MIQYFAYGSNLHPLRLLERVPSAELVGTIALKRYQLRFHKKSNDGSGKCSLLYTSDVSNFVCGAIYYIDPAHKNELDKFEGKGCGYIDNHIHFNIGGNKYSCFTYVAQQTHIIDNLRPYHWYKQLVVLGARYLSFPGTYISAIESVESIKDQDSERTMQNEALINRIIQYR